MQETVETTSLLSRKRLRVYLAPEGIAITERRPFSSWEHPRLIPFDHVQGVQARRAGRRWALELALAQGPLTVGGLAESEALWLAGLIGEELGIRARRADPRFAERAPLERFQGAIEALLSAGEREAASVVDFLLLQAVHHRASDVHFDPFHAVLRVRFRIDGLLSDVAEIGLGLHPRMLARLKVLAKLAVYRHDVPQEGRTVVESGNRTIDLRVSVLPTIHGEKAVIRLFDSSRAIFGLQDLGMSSRTLARYSDLINRPQGTILLTGPANSGKTTTLYSTLSHLYERRRNLSNIVTVEDPVEHDLQVISQTQINPAMGLTFATGLRTVLRQDPEVIMVGEIRDAETAEIAVRAGLTGHLIFSTAHARSAPGVFARLVEMGVEPFLVASSVTGVMEQRLVRRICPGCVAGYRPDGDLLRRAGIRPEASASFRHGTGCDRCGGSGYLGRTGIFSLVVVDERIRDLVMAKAALAALEEAASRTSPGLLAEGRDQVAAGVTTAEELLRVVEPEA
jgi:type II secretory ATPase GspE/PulE/Tfp pilus assembly ATPase PilB-like protein